MTDLGLCIYNSLWQVDTCHACRLDTAIPMHIDTLQVCKEVVMSVLWPWSVFQQTKSHCKGRSSDLSRCCAFPIILTSGKECIQQKETYSNWYCSGFAPDSLITVCSKKETYCSKLWCKDMLFFLIFKKRNKKTSATLVSVADAVICLLIVNCLEFGV